MYLKEYQNQPNFSNQYYYLKEYFKNPLLSQKKIIQEIKCNFQQFISSTKVEKPYQFKQFYDFLLSSSFFEQPLREYIKDILQSPVLDAYTVLELLKHCDKSSITSNDEIIKILTSFVSTSYNKYKLYIIKEYLPPEKQEQLLLRQIKEYLKDHLSKKEDAEFCYKLIKLLINDPFWGPIEPIKFLNAGGYKSIYKFQNVVLQLGEKPHVKELPPSPYICAPLFFYIIENTQISISPFLQDKVNETEIQNCWNHNCDHQVLILDVKPENFGTYLQDYIHPFKEAPILAKKFLGIDVFDLSDTKAGTTKLLDLDYYRNKNHFYENNDFNRFLPYYIDYEIQYEQQKKLQKK